MSRAVGNGTELSSHSWQTSTWLCALAVGALAMGAPTQVRVDQGQDFVSQRAAPEGWAVIEAAAAGVEFAVPPGFERLARRAHTPVRLRGMLGGRRATIRLSRFRNDFGTISRVLRALRASSKIESVRSFFINGEIAALVRRRVPKRRRVVYSVITCPLRRAIHLEAELPLAAEAASIGEAHRVLGTFRLVPLKQLTIAKTTPELQRRADIELGFAGPQRAAVESLDSEHFRLFTTAASGRKLLELLEKELVPRLTRWFGKPAHKVDRLRVYLHRSRSGYELAAVKNGMSEQRAASLEGHSWDGYYSTYYSGPRASVHIHEGVHQYMTAALGLDGGGTWLQEGLAQWIEADFGKRSPARAARNTLRKKKGDFPALKRILVARTFLFRPKERFGLSCNELYDVSASLVRYLAQEHHNEFRALISELGVLPPSDLGLLEAAFRRRIGLDLGSLEKAWRRWLLEEI